MLWKAIVAGALAFVVAMLQATFLYQMDVSLFWFIALVISDVLALWVFLTVKDSMA